MVAVCESAVRHVFQSTLSMRRATAVAMIRSHAGPFQSTLSMRRATCSTQSVRVELRISIHALHEESDDVIGGVGMAEIGISIHALHEESDRLL